MLIPLLLAAAQILPPLKPAAPGMPAEMVAPDELEFRTTLFEVMNRAQVDPSYAASERTGERSGTFYFKGDAKAHLARFTSDPRITAVSVPLSAAELGTISHTFMLWVRRRGFEWEQAWADPQAGLVHISTKQPYLLEKMAKDEGIDMTHIRVSDARPPLNRYVPERS